MIESHVQDVKSHQICQGRKALRVISRGKQRLTVYRAHQVLMAWRLFNLDFFKIHVFVWRQTIFTMVIWVIGMYIASGVAWLFLGTEDGRPIFRTLGPQKSNFS